MILKRYHQIDQIARTGMGYTIEELAPVEATAEAGPKNGFILTIGLLCLLNLSLIIPPNMCLFQYHARLTSS